MEIQTHKILLSGKRGSRAYQQLLFPLDPPNKDFIFNLWFNCAMNVFASWNVIRCMRNPPSIIIFYTFNWVWKLKFRRLLLQVPGFLSSCRLSLMATEIEMRQTCRVPGLKDSHGRVLNLAWCHKSILSTLYNNTHHTLRIRILPPPEFQPDSQHFYVTTPILGITSYRKGSIMD